MTLVTRNKVLVHIYISLPNIFGPQYVHTDFISSYQETSTVKLIEM